MQYKHNTTEETTVSSAITDLNRKLINLEITVDNLKRTILNLCKELDDLKKGQPKKDSIFDIQVLNY